MSTEHEAAAQFPVKVVLADDAETLRTLLARALERDPRIRIVATVGDGRAAILAVEDTNADVLLLDLSMPEMSGVDVLQQVAGRLAVVVLTGYGDPTLRRRCMDLGAKGFVSKGASVAMIVEALISAVGPEAGTSDDSHAAGGETR